MKRTNKFIAISAIVLVFFCFCTVCAAAESVSSDISDAYGSVALTDAEDTETTDDLENNTSALTEEKNVSTEADAAGIDSANSNITIGSVTDTENSTASPESEKNFFEALYGAISENSAEIASIAAAVCSMILAFVMSRGLTPMLKNALGGIARAASELGEDVRESEKHSATVTDALMERLSLTEATVERLTGVIETLSERSTHDQEEQLMREDILTVMSAQVELLYDLFMSSALPEYKKAAVGERVSLMRHKLVPAGEKKDEA